MATKGKSTASKTKRAATAAAVNPGSLAGIGGAVTAAGVAFGGDPAQWAVIGGTVSSLAVLAAAIFGARGQRSGS